MRTILSYVGTHYKNIENRCYLFYSIFGGSFVTRPERKRRFSRESVLLVSLQKDNMAFSPAHLVPAEPEALEEVLLKR